MSLLHPVIPFKELHKNTDLCLRPPNWLSSTISNSLPCFGYSKFSNGFSSFSMIAEAPDSLCPPNAVDVVSDSENIKKLLKIPYDSSSPLSMLVHRIGKTLLIDDFDIHKYGLQAPEEEAQFFRKLLLEKVLGKLPVSASIVKKSALAVQERTLVSKFLYRSVYESESQSSVDSSSISSTRRRVRRSVSSEQNDLFPPLPEPSSNSSSKTFSRQLIWNFEDIRMLIGSDMPIFGDEDHPSISLRLHSLTQPINILTGIDYWLDNLMCQIPEVLMCYHLDGIVQKYEHHKTEDLPILTDSPFSPYIIRSVAQNILSFLRANAAKEGHTYWLFKAKNDEVVKLYDLTYLCDGSQPLSQNDSKNPFQDVVSMLLYKVAQNMILQKTSCKEFQTIRRLLSMCLTLLDTSLYPQIAIASHFMMAELLLPYNTNPSKPESLKSLTTTKETHIGKRRRRRRRSKDEWSGIPSAVNLSSLLSDVPYTPSSSLERKILYSSPSESKDTLNEHEEAYGDDEGINEHEEAYGDDEGIYEHEETYGDDEGIYEHEEAYGDKDINEHDSEDVLERCVESLSHVLKGLRTLLKVSKDGESKVVENSTQVFSASHSYNSETPYALLLSSSTLYKESPHKMKIHLKSLLLQKTSLICLTMSEAYVTSGVFGCALRSILRALNCFQFFSLSKESKTQKYGDDVSFAISLAGHIYDVMSESWHNIHLYTQQYNSSMEEIDVVIEKNCEFDDFSVHLPTIKLPDTLVEALTLSLQCYSLAISVLSEFSSETEKTQIYLLRRGNLENKLGTWYMNAAHSLNYFKEEKEAQHLYSKSHKYYSDGIQTFSLAHSVPNVALLHSNFGRHYRMLASSIIKDESAEFSSSESEYYHLAFRHYDEAFKCLETMNEYPKEVWKSISWELSTTLFNYGKIHQDRPPLSYKSQEEIDELILKTFQRALLLLQNETTRIGMFRKGYILHSFGSHHSHKAINLSREERSKIKRHRALGESFYIKASNIFQSLGLSVKSLTILLERLSLVEAFMGASNMRKSTRDLLTLLSEDLLVILKSWSKASEEDPIEEDEAFILHFHLPSKIQSIFLALHKSHSSCGKKKSDWSRTLYCQSLSLSISPSLSQIIDFLKSVPSLADLSLK